MTYPLVLGSQPDRHKWPDRTKGDKHMSLMEEPPEMRPITGCFGGDAVMAQQAFEELLGQVAVKVTPQPKYPLDVCPFSDDGEPGYYSKGHHDPAEFLFAVVAEYGGYEDEGTTFDPGAVKHIWYQDADDEDSDEVWFCECLSTDADAVPYTVIFTDMPGARLT